MIGEGNLESASDHRDALAFAIQEYGHALIHIAWYRAGRSRFLLFGLVELYPKEFPQPVETIEQSLALKMLGGQNYLYFKRVSLLASDALVWYQECVNGRVVLPKDTNRDGTPKSLTVSVLAQEPTWPQTIFATDEVTWLPPAWESPRVHHILQADLPSEAQEAVSLINTRTWLSERLMLDFQSYSELLGSLHFVAPNPRLRSVHHGLDMSDGQQEKSEFKIQPRSGHTLDGLRLIVLDRRHTGLGDFIEVPISSNKMVIYHPIGTTGELESFIRDREGKVLAWSRSTGFMTSVGVNLILSGTQQTIHVPGTSSTPAETYIRGLAGPATTTLVGTPRPPKDSIPLLARARARREAQKLAEEFPEKWFHGESAEATKFVRELISSAKERLWIVDPYFTTVELVRYALATSSVTLPVLIVTGAEAMKTKDRIDPDLFAAEILDRQLPLLRQHGNLTVHVLRGRSAVHDRFIVVDDSVWFSGNSLHTIGERAGMMVKLRNSSEIIANLTEILNSDRAAAWTDWIREWRAIRALKPRHDVRGLLAAVLAVGVGLLGFSFVSAVGRERRR